MPHRGDSARNSWPSRTRWSETVTALRAPPTIYATSGSEGPPSALHATPRRSHRGGGGPARAQRDDAGDRPQPPQLDDDPHERHPRAGRAVRGGDSGRRGAVRALVGAQSGAGDGAGAENRLRGGREAGQGSGGEERHRPPTGDGEGAVEGEGAGGGPRFAGYDGARRARRAEMTLTSETQL